MRRLALTSVAAAGLAFSAAGCGGGDTPPAVANLATITSTGGQHTSPGTASRATADAAFAACLTSHGFPASVGSPSAHPSGKAVVLGGVVIPGVNPGSPQFQSALSACKKFMPGGGPPSLTPAQEAERSKALAALAACMRRHGVATFPEPDGRGDYPLGSIEQLDPQSAVFQAAYKACWSLYPKVGPQMRLAP
jgi:hypothetical protein